MIETVAREILFVLGWGLRLGELYLTNGEEGSRTLR